MIRSTFLNSDFLGVLSASCFSVDITVMETQMDQLPAGLECQGFSNFSQLSKSFIYLVPLEHQSTAHVCLTLC